jgi:hypothetical protein
MDQPLQSAEFQRAFAIAFLINGVWITVSEFFRYLVFVKPMMAADFPQIPDIVPMNGPVVMIWMVWGAILVAAVTGFTWMVLERFGGSNKNVLLAGTAVWLSVFCIFWLAAWNMNIAKPNVMMVALPLAWLEMVIAAAVVGWSRSHFGQTQGV